MNHYAQALAERRPKIEEGMLQGKEMLLFAQLLVLFRQLEPISKAILLKEFRTITI